MTTVSLADWLTNRWIVGHEPSREEIADLFAVVDRDLKDAAVPRLSADWQLGISYNAALQLATRHWRRKDIDRAESEVMSERFSRCGTPLVSRARRSTSWTLSDASETRSTMSTRG